MARPFKCPYCGSGKTRPKGQRPTIALGLRRIRLCRACGHKFTVGVRPPALTKPKKSKARGRRG